MAMECILALNSIAQTFTRPLSLDINQMGWLARICIWLRLCTHAHWHPTRTPEYRACIMARGGGDLGHPWHKIAKGYIKSRVYIALQLAYTFTDTNLTRMLQKLTAFPLVHVQYLYGSALQSMVELWPPNLWAAPAGPGARGVICSRICSDFLGNQRIYLLHDTGSGDCLDTRKKVTNLHT